MAKRFKADPFDVWGKPPIFLDRLTKRELRQLRSYVETITGKCYRIAYDNGFTEGLCKVSLVATNEMKQQRDRMLKSK